VTDPGGPYTDSWPIYNVPMYEANTASSSQFWLNYVEQLVNAINEAGDAGKLKIAAFDDTPASMTDKMNQIVNHSGGYSPPFNFAVTTGSGNGGYQYLWNNDLEAFFQAVPSNSAGYLSYVRSQAESAFGENPYFVVDDSWVNNDTSIASVVQGEDDWFGVPSPTYTNQAFGGETFGATVPGFNFVNSTTNTVIDPNHGTTLVNDLQDTVGKNDALTLVEGFTDWSAGAALWRTETPAKPRPGTNSRCRTLRTSPPASPAPTPAPSSASSSTASTDPPSPYRTPAAGRPGRPSAPAPSPSTPAPTTPSRSST
jgi:hypothetical protein